VYYRREACGEVSACAPSVGHLRSHYAVKHIHKTLEKSPGRERYEGHLSLVLGDPAEVAHTMCVISQCAGSLARDTSAEQCTNAPKRSNTYVFEACTTDTRDLVAVETIMR
jgi:hypothetical protein